ncbi:unnamed protein product [Echinostoma caproni]|uniref:SAP30-binding protein n=1 Tax=Echinostoma caproni TaxID=27848 RepID=A0A183ALM5_9TREM|nr:unnamed protein product [Echinostoma caproni]
MSEEINNHEFESQLSKAPSLVSYTIDDDDDDEHTAPSDEETSDSQHSLSNKVRQPDEAAPDSTMDTSVSPLPTGDFPFISLDEPPTILSSSHQMNKEPILVLSQDHLQNPPALTENHHEPDSSASQSEFTGEQNRASPGLDDVQLPPEPTGHCRMELQEKVDREVRRMRLDISYDPNRAIQDNKAFRNPSIYEKLISFLNIDEKGTNFPQEIYDPYRWTPQSYYDELARVQNREIDRLLKLQKEQKKSEGNQQNNSAPGATGNIQDMTNKNTLMSSASVSTGFVEPKKRSKWDAGVPESNTTNNATGSEPTKVPVAPPVGGLIKQK